MRGGMGAAPLIACGFSLEHKLNHAHTACRPPLQSLALLAEGVASGAAAAAAAAADVCHDAAAALLGPPGRALVAAARLLCALLLPVYQVRARVVQCGVVRLMSCCIA